MSARPGAAALAALAAALLALGGAAPAAAAGDAARGKAVFQRCALCHSLAAGANGVGPSLHGVLGRKAGTAPDFRFSTAMRSSGIVWDAGSLRRFLGDPEAAVPGTKMASGAVADPQALADLLAYLKAAGR